MSGSARSSGLSEAVARVEALTFDVFGTIVDWRTSIVRELQAFGAARGIAADWCAFTDAWRALYEPQLARVREGKLPWTKLDDLHRASLEELLVRFDVRGLGEAEKDHVNRVWHRLDPWPDSLPGLRRLHEKYPLATLSNGNVALLVHMARRAGLPWDAVLGAEIARQYKPEPEPYLVTAELLGLAPERCMLVAAHNYDLVAAGRIGYRTAFVVRPTEYGPGQTRDLRPEQPFDLVAKDLVDLADQLGC
jgi:2-haloacid dehalogenase